MSGLQSRSLKVSPVTNTDPFKITINLFAFNEGDPLTASSHFIIFKQVRNNQVTSSDWVQCDILTHIYNVLLHIKHGNQHITSAIYHFCIVSIHKTVS